MGVRTVYFTSDDERRMAEAAARLQGEGVDVKTSSRGTDDWYSRVEVIRALLDLYLTQGDNQWPQTPTKDRT